MDQPQKSKGPHPRHAVQIPQTKKVSQRRKRSCPTPNPPSFPCNTPPPPRPYRRRTKPPNDPPHNISTRLPKRPAPEPPKPSLQKPANATSRPTQAWRRFVSKKPDRPGFQLEVGGSRSCFVARRCAVMVSRGVSDRANKAESCSLGINNERLPPTSPYIGFQEFRIEK